MSAVIHSQCNGLCWSSDATSEASAHSAQRSLKATEQGGSIPAGLLQGNSPCKRATKTTYFITSMGQPDWLREKTNHTFPQKGSLHCKGTCITHRSQQKTTTIKKNRSYSPLCHTRLAMPMLHIRSSRKDVQLHTLKDVTHKSRALQAVEYFSLTRRAVKAGIHQNELFLATQNSTLK